MDPVEHYWITGGLSAYPVPVPDQWWSSVYDAGPSLIQHRPMLLFAGLWYVLGPTRSQNSFQNVLQVTWQKGHSFVVLCHPVLIFYSFRSLRGDAIHLVAMILKPQHWFNSYHHGHYNYYAFVILFHFNSTYTYMFVLVCCFCNGNLYFFLYNYIFYFWRTKPGFIFLLYAVQVLCIV